MRVNYMAQNNDNLIAAKTTDGIGFYSSLISNIDIMSRMNMPLSTINEFCIVNGLTNKEIENIYNFVSSYQLIRKTIANNIIENQKKKEDDIK